jgi:hypothetical protein
VAEFTNEWTTNQAHVNFSQEHINSHSGCNLYRI